MFIDRLLSNSVIPRALLIAAVSLTVSPTASLADGLNALIDGGKPALDIRYRYEAVDQAGRVKDADANTMRIRAGFETGRINLGGLEGIGGAFDVEWIEHIGGQAFNDTINGKTTYPVVADPDDFAVNQLYLSAVDTIPGTKVKIGRQRMIWDNARFIGNVGFRQNEQTLTRPAWTSPP